MIVLHSLSCHTIAAIHRFEHGPALRQASTLRKEAEFLKVEARFLFSVF
jgi:hypothetical protein